MSARILVVDDIPANVRLLEAKLLVEYYDVMTASSGAEALEIIAETPPDIILLDVMMPGMDGFEVCRRIRAQSESAHIPVVMVTALSDVRDRVHGLEAGADDFLTKPVNDTALFARIRSLVRLKRAIDEWQTRESTLMQFGGAGATRPTTENDRPGQILVAAADADIAHAMAATLTGCGHGVAVEASAADALARAVDGNFHLILVDDWIGGEDGLRLCSQLRSHEQTRTTPMVLMIEMVDQRSQQRLAKALEIGVNDYIVKPIDRDEIIARARTQVRRRRYENGLRENFEQSIVAALTDSLTGLHNRRYLEAHFDAVCKSLADAGKPVALMILDVDRFKSVNDEHGHGVGDEVLRLLANRILANCRSVETAVRLGGEEFVVVMPGSPLDAAEITAERLRLAVADLPFVIGGETGDLSITISVGVAADIAGTVPLEDLIQRADEALYEAKRSGRNRVLTTRQLEHHPSGRRAAAV
jgi:two-component system, cell cycle response regulator